MSIGEAKSFIDQLVHLTWVDRKGAEVFDAVNVFDVGFVPLYGPCLITNRGEIRLDRVLRCETAERLAS